jgi:hypothetical protein
MKPIDLTIEILIRKHFGESVDENWIQWAVDMMMAGFESEHVVELAGISKPYNQFELKELTDRVFDELGLDFSDQQSLVINYTTFLAKNVLAGRRDLLKSLRALNQLFNTSDHDEIIQDFYLLYYAKEDLNYSALQWYWDGADRENIDQICLDRFRKWIEDYDS